MQKKSKARFKSKISWIIASAFAGIWLIITFVPFLFLVLNSFKDKFEIFTQGIFALPKTLNYDNYLEVFSGGIVHFFINSVIVLVVSLYVLLFVTACASYPLARFKFRFSKPIYGFIVACMSIPLHVTLIPIFKLSTNIGIYDTIWALIGPYIAFGIPISVFILTSFMKMIPIEIEEAADIDGCNKYQIFLKIMVPLSKPGLATIAIYNGVNMWNEFSFAYTLTQSVENRTLPLALWEFQGRYSANIPMIMTVLTLTLLPMVVMYAIFKDKLVKGMTAGAVKG